MKYLPALLLLLLAPVACSSERSTDAPVTEEAAAAQGLPDRDPELARRLVDEDNALLLDVRTPEEFAEGYAEGATNIPVQQLADRLSEIEQLLEGDHQRPIVVYCRSGRRATRAKEMLLEAGFSKVTNLGGLTDWTGPRTQP